MISAGEMNVAGKCPEGTVFIPGGESSVDTPYGYRHYGLVLKVDGETMPPREVEVPDLCWDKHAVTNPQYAQAMGDTFQLVVRDCTFRFLRLIMRDERPEKLIKEKEKTLQMMDVCAAGLVPNKSPVGFDGARQPRVEISFEEAKAYCKKRGGRLPTGPEREWVSREPIREHGAQPGDIIFNPDVCAQGEAAHGLCDMQGGVYEYVDDFGYDPVTHQMIPASIDPRYASSLGLGGNILGSSSLAVPLPVEVMSNFLMSTDSADAGKWYLGFRCVYDPKKE